MIGIRLRGRCRIIHYTSYPTVTEARGAGSHEVPVKGILEANSECKIQPKLGLGGSLNPKP